MKYLLVAIDDDPYEPCSSMQCKLDNITLFVGKKKDDIQRYFTEFNELLTSKKIRKKGMSTKNTFFRWLHEEKGLKLVTGDQTQALLIPWNYL